MRHSHMLKETFQNISVWYDLLALPPNIFLKRIIGRLLGKSNSKESIVIDDDISIRFTDNWHRLKFNFDPKLREFFILQYLNDNVDILGSGWRSTRMELGENSKIDWQRDITTGFRWDESKPSADQFEFGARSS
jgi:hypothetical protein